MFVFKRRNIIIIFALIVTFVTFIVCFSALSTVKAGIGLESKIKVVIDAGHGGIDNGVTGKYTGVKESQLNLIISKKIGALFEDAGIEVVYTRNTESGLYGVATASLKRKDMQKREEIIKKTNPNLVLSIHMNYYSMPSRRGAQVFYKADDDKGKNLARFIQNELNEMPDASRECSILSGDYYILNCTNFPSALVECGFLSNMEDEKLLTNSTYQDNISYTIFKGAMGFLLESVGKVFEE